MEKTAGVKIGNEEIGKVLNTVAYILDLFLKLPDDMTKGRKGGYFSVFDGIYNPPLAIVRIGEPDINFAEDYFKFSPEKAIRLKNLTEHLSSWQSRNPNRKEWGGAIKSPDFILSFSGLPELADEAVVLLIAYGFGWINYNQLWEIVRISDNPYVEPLYRKLYYQ